MLSEDHMGQRIFTIRQRESDGHFVSRTDRPGDGLLAVDPSFEKASVHARRAAIVAASRDRCRVMVMAENPQGFMERVTAVEPRVAGDGSFVVLL
jgi:hypothetical protein